MVSHLKVRTIGLVLIGSGILHACRTPAAKQSSSEVYGVVTESDPENFFAYKDFKPVRTYTNSEVCGHQKSGLKILKDSGNIKVYNSIAYYLAGMQGGQPNLSYALQWYDPSATGSAGGTPIIRLVNKTDYPKYFESENEANNNCNFAAASGDPNRTAIMFVYGVSSAGRGESLPMLDYNMLSALINFELTPNTPPPNGDGKIGKLPAYIQMVANKNSPSDGPFGKHDADAATKVAFNISLAYKGGVEKLDVITHSNGMISSQIGYSYFAYYFMRTAEMRDQFCKTRASAQGVKLTSGSCESQVKPLKINFFHLQAAPDELWTVGKKPPNNPGFYTDFVPVFEQKSKGTVSAVLSYPPEDLRTYFYNLRNHINWSFRYYYNNADFLTYPPTAGIGTLLLSPAAYLVGKNGYSSVGINESIHWVQYALKLEKLLGQERFLIGHYFCNEDSFSSKSCGRKHSAYSSLMDIAHPTRIQFENWKVWYKP